MATPSSCGRFGARDQTCAITVTRWILNHYATKELQETMVLYNACYHERKVDMH